MLNQPRFILISRSALTKSPERVAEAVRMTPIAGAFCAADLDAKLSQGVLDPQIGVTSAFALVADFPFDMAVVSEGGAVELQELPEILVESV